MDEGIIDRFNQVVGINDTTIHAGDFTLISNVEEVYKKYVKRLNGLHVFLIGSHDRWNKSKLSIFERNIEGYHVVVCHYAMRVWPRSHYNSWNLHGHSHGKLEPIGKQHDIGVDVNNFYPVSFEQLKLIMNSKTDNFNLVDRI